MAAIIYIGGAPRSGTTMLVRALDWHPETLVYPREATHLAALFFAGHWIEPSPRAKELAYGGATERPAMFNAAYVAATAGSAAAPITRYHTALADALLAGFPHYTEYYGQGPGPTPVFKLPFFCEAMADAVAAEGTDVRLIHVQRDAVARYCSAKARRTASDLPAGMDFASFHGIVPAASLDLAKQTERNRSGSVHFARYEDLRSDVNAMLEIATFLGIQWHPSLSQQSSLGVPRMLPSAYGFRNRGGSSDDDQRASAMSQITNTNEREYIALLDKIARGDDASHESLLRLARLPFVSDSVDAPDMRATFVTDRLKSLVSDGIGQSLVAIMRTERVGAL